MLLKLHGVNRIPPLPELNVQVPVQLMVILHGVIRNDDLQCWNNVVTIQNNVATMNSVVLKIDFANRLM